MTAEFSEDEIKSQGSVSIEAGVNQLSKLICPPGLKNTENWPPSGPIHKRFSLP